MEKVTHEDVADFLISIGWTGRCDAQWHQLRDAMPELREMLAVSELHHESQKTAEQLWLDTGKLRSEIADLKVVNNKMSGVVTSWRTGVMSASDAMIELTKTLEKQ